MKYFFTKSLKESFKNQIQTTNQNQQNLILNIIQIGDNLSSTQYVNLKQKVGRELGIEVVLHKYNQETKIEEIKNDLKNNVTNQKQGLIIQLPIPKEFDSLLTDRELWDNKLDIDFLTSFKRDEYNQFDILPPTIQGIDLVIRAVYLFQDFKLKNLETKINLQGTTIGVIGQGRLVGGFMLEYLKNREATIISINQYSKDIKNLIQNCDIIVTATGQKGLIKSQMINSLKTKLLIDVGSSEQNGSIYGDLDYEDFEDNSDNHPNLIICPSKGGVGPLTVLSLFWGLSKLRDLELEQSS
jgi:methylenetetrahydrofolate dehydrogenase (NADP+) / methenyltetrahydrofolate cyclohydrolase